MWCLTCDRRTLTLPLHEDRVFPIHSGIQCVDRTPGVTFRDGSGRGGPTDRVVHTSEESLVDRLDPGVEKDGQQKNKRVRVERPQPDDSSLFYSEKFRRNVFD